MGRSLIFKSEMQVSPWWAWVRDLKYTHSNWYQYSLTQFKGRDGSGLLVSTNSSGSQESRRADGLKAFYKLLNRGPHYLPIHILGWQFIGRESPPKTSARNLIIEPAERSKC